MSVIRGMRAEILAEMLPDSLPFDAEEVGRARSGREFAEAAMAWVPRDNLKAGILRLWLLRAWAASDLAEAAHHLVEASHEVDRMRDRGLL